MAVWDDYPQDYRSSEVQSILTAVRAGECVYVVGLSGAGKSNLMGFLYHRANLGQPDLILVDGNRAQPRSAGGLFHLIAGMLDPEAGSGSPQGSLSEAAAWVEQAAARRMAQSPGGFSLLIDRLDALSPEECRTASGPLRALRDTYKYQLTYVMAARRPPDPTDELAELFYANTLWLGPLAPPDARWSAAQYAGRRGQRWDAETIEELVRVSWGYPSLLRACCEAYSASGTVDTEALRDHPAVQRRVQEFWADAPSAEDVRRAGLAGQPLLAAAQAPVSAASPDLTASEHRLLAYFQAHPGEVCGKDDLIRAVWPEEQVSQGLRDDSLAQLIRRLRTKIEPDPARPTRLLTVPGRGYRYVESA